jgi:hypothetical protein
VTASEISVGENGVKVFKQTVSYSGGTDKVSSADEEDVEVDERRVVKIRDPAHLGVFLSVNTEEAGNKSFNVAEKVFEVSGCSISLFDQVFGPSDDNVQADDTEHEALEVEPEEGNKVEGDRYSELLVVGFEPKEFLGQVKELAKNVTCQTAVDFTVTQNHLSAYYKTVGHQQLQLDQLVPSNQGRKSFASETMLNNPAQKTKKQKRSKKSDDIVVDLIPEKGHESRERRKSKYLSPPYVNLIGSGVPKGSLTLEEHEIDKLHEDSASVDNHNKKLQASKKHHSGPINESSAKLLSLLESTALDCCYCDGRKIDVVERYFLRFRKAAYQNILFEESAEEENLVEVSVEKVEKKSEEETSANSKKPKKRQVKVTGDLPDLNQTNSGLQVESPKIEPKKRKRDSKNKSSETFLPNLEGSSAKVVPVGINKPAAPLDPTINQQKVPATSSAIPDLNGNTGEDIKPKTKRKKKEPVVVLTADFDYSKLQLNGEGKGTALLLKFSPESPLPSKESLISTFSNFGELQESETQVLAESSNAQVIFLDDSNARDAFRSLANSSPFGVSLVNYRLLDLTVASAVIQEDIKMQIPPKPKKTNPVVPKRAPVKAAVPPAVTAGTPGQQGEVFVPPSGMPGQPKVEVVVPPGGTPGQQNGEVASDIAAIKKRLEMMTTMMQQAGDTLPVETRAKLQNDINVLLAKVTSSG